MDITAILKSLEASGLATRIRDGLLFFPLIESTHVIALALVFGTITIVDLRLLGLASTTRPFGRIASDVLKWTWTAFALSVVTGALMFITNAQVYFYNTYFRFKILLLVLSGLNMLYFEATVGRKVESWGDAGSVPRAGKVAAILSLTIWIAVIVTGRMIGFTTTRAASNAAPPPPATVDFDDFLTPGGSQPSAPPAEK